MDYKIDYKLAKQLKDAGFPQTDSRYFWSKGAGKPVKLDRLNLPKYATAECKETYSIPTLSELIEACGDRFGNLRKEGNTWIAFDNNGHGEDKNSKTPEIAVSKLYIALKKK